MQVKKRNEKLEAFDQNKIASSIQQTMLSAGVNDDLITNLIIEQSNQYIDRHYSSKDQITTDDIRSAINIIFLDNNQTEAAKIYSKTRGQKIDKQQNICSYKKLKRCH